MATEEQLQERAIMAGHVFNPNTPVSEKDLFSGRTNQIRRVIDVIFQKGQHVIIFGERGVGKTSLANVLSSFVSTPSAQNQLLSTRINCDRADSFKTVWEKVFDEMNLTKSKLAIGFSKEQNPQMFTAKDFFPTGNITPNEVRKAIIQVSNIFFPVIIFDEFDRLDLSVRKLFADLIKSLSDHSLNVTIILIGVGDSVDQIISEHQSVSRALVQVQMPRMTPDEIKAIINNSLTRLGMTISDDTLSQISILSKGLPHYAHLIGLHSTRDALDNKSTSISNDNLNNAIKKAVQDVQYSITTNYHKAIRSAHKDNIFPDVLLACALSSVNELGEFAAQDLRNPIYKITKKKYDIPSYARHLNEFSSDKRGNILIKSGERRSYRYKFADPLMQPFIIMQGLIDKKITSHSLI